jgi:hypothetical protein
MRAARAELVLALVLTTIAAAPTAAQTAASSFADLQGRLTADQTIYVQTAEVADEYGRGIKGKVLELSGSTLRLLVNGERRELSERDVLVISERHTRAGRGAVIGLAVGGALGLWFDRSLRNAICGNCVVESDDLLIIALVAGLGTGFGAEIGHSLEHESVLFLAPDLRQSRRFTTTPFIGQGRKGLAAIFRF